MSDIPVSAATVKPRAFLKPVEAGSLFAKSVKKSLFLTLKIN